MDGVGERHRIVRREPVERARDALERVGDAIEGREEPRHVAAKQVPAVPGLVERGQCAPPVAPTATAGPCGRKPPASALSPSWTSPSVIACASNCRRDR